MDRFESGYRIGRPRAERALRFLLIGGITAVCYIGAMAFMVDVMSTSATAGAVVAFIVGTIVSYLGNSLYTFDVALTFEANAANYGCKFVTHTDEAIALVKTVDRPGIRLQLDTGTIALNDEPESVIEAAAPLTGHFHSSEPDLVPVGSSRTDHRTLGRRLREAGYDGWRSVEMRACEDWQGAMRRAANVMAAAYS